MKKNRLLILIIFAIIGCSAIFMGCNSDKIIIPDDHEEAGYQMVRMYYNGGQEGSNSDVTYFIEKGGRLPTPDISLKSELIVPTKAGYELEGWFEIKPDMLKERDIFLYDEYMENGVPVKKEVINVKNEHAKKTVYYIKNHDFENSELDTPQEPLSYNDFLAEQADDFVGERIFAKYQPWDFDFDRIEKDTYLVAIWAPQRYYVVVPEENKSDTFDEVGYNKLPKHNISASGAILRPNDTHINIKKGYKIEGFYHDKYFTKPIDFGDDNRWYPPVEYVAGTEIFKIVPIYTRWLNEKFEIVTEASQLSYIGSSTNYYIKEHLDFTDVTVNMPEVYRGEILGNGKVWKNLTMRTKQINDGGSGKDIYGGVFNDLSGAKIKEITFENLSVIFECISEELDKVNWARQVEVQLFARSFDERTELRDIVISSVTTASTYTRIDSTAFGRFYNIPRLDANGNIIRYKNLNESTANPDGSWPHPDSYYDTNYLGKIPYVCDTVKDENGDTLWGYQILELPENAFIPEFKESVLSSTVGNIEGCFADMTEKPVVIDWTYTFGPDKTAPRPLADIVINLDTYVFAGWYYKVEKTLTLKTGDVETYTDFVKQDINEVPDTDVELFAMWKLSE